MRLSRYCVPGQFFLHQDFDGVPLRLWPVLLPETGDGRKERKSLWTRLKAEEVWAGRVKLKVAKKEAIPAYKQVKTQIFRSPRPIYGGFMEPRIASSIHQVDSYALPQIWHEIDDVR